MTTELRTEIQRDKNETLLLLLIFYFLAGIGLFFFDQKSTFYDTYLSICSVFNTLFMLRWFTLDAKQREFAIPFPLMLVLVFINALGSIIYFVMTRQKADAGRIIVKSAWWLLSCVMLSSMGYLFISALLGP